MGFQKEGQTNKGQIMHHFTQNKKIVKRNANPIIVTKALILFN